MSRTRHHHKRNKKADRPPRGRREKMKAAGALCSVCQSHDVQFDGRSVFKYDYRPTFKCGSCGAGWTSGTLGKPYSDFCEIDDRLREEDVDWFIDPVEREAYLKSARMAVKREAHLWAKQAEYELAERKKFERNKLHRPKKRSKLF